MEETSNEQFNKNEETDVTQQTGLPSFFIPDRNGVMVEMKRNHPDESYQWVTGIISYSSSYERGWEAHTVIGPPRNYPAYGDIRGAWAAARSSGTMEYLDLRYDHGWFVTGVDIFETYNPGHVIAVLAKVDNYWIPLWNGKVAQFGQRPPEISRIFSPKLLHIPLRTDSIRVELDCTTAKSWAEIDCVLMRGVNYFSWIPENHHLYPVSFREAVFTLLCINVRTGYWTRDSIIEIIKHTAVEWPWTENDAKQHRGVLMTKSIEDSLPTFVVDPESIEKMEALGFNTEECTQALMACNNDVEQAINLLLSYTHT